MVVSVREMQRPEPGKIEVQNLPALIEKGEVLIPRFQRDFVWNPKDCAGLLDSILKNYPIGTLTLWKTSQFRMQVFRIADLDFPTPALGIPVNYVLDGQQRITSVLAAIKGLNIHGQDYSQIYLRLDGPDEDGRYVTNDIENLNPNRCISIRDLYEGRVTTWLHRFGDDEETISVLDTLRDRLRNYPIPMICLADSSIEVATEIFTRINTEGKHLSTFEIMCAKVYDEIRDFDLLRKCEELKEFWSRTDFETISNATVLQALGLCLGKSAKGADILSLGREVIIEKWGRIALAFNKAIEYLKSAYGIPGSRFLPYDAMVLPFVYYFFVHSCNRPEPEHARYLADYFWRCGLSQRYKDGLVGKVTQDVEMVKGLLSGRLPAIRPSVNISTAAIAAEGEYRVGSAYVRTFLCLLAGLKPRSFDDGSAVTLDNSWLTTGGRKNGHHFFPKAFMKHVGIEKNVNNIVNITLLDARLNRDVIRDRAPSDYMSVFKRQNSDLARTMQTHLVGDLADYGILNDDYDTFFRSRVKAFQKAFKDKLVPRVGDVMDDGPVPLIPEMTDARTLVSKGPSKQHASSRQESKSNTRKDFAMLDLCQYEMFVSERHPGTGTASSYRRALLKLDIAFRAANPKPFWMPDDLFRLTDSSSILRLKRYVEQEQNRFMVNASSIFDPYRGKGDSYFRKRWCSAALEELAVFWNHQQGR